MVMMTNVLISCSCCVQQNEWVHLNSRQAGLFWFNKRTGETRRQQPAEVGLQERAEEQER